MKELVEHMARISNPQNQNKNVSVGKLWNYLQKHKHWSPFEMVSICLEINTTRAIGRQLLRHRSFSFQEFSQRYADPTEPLGFSFQEARTQDLSNRQNSHKTEDRGLMRFWEAAQARVKDIALSEYIQALSNGIAKEQARALLPEGLTNSRLYMNGTLRSWLHFIEVRTDVSAQEEVRQLAEECSTIITNLIEGETNL
tara:strand:- start:842 stop:1435 length:594 start_codon:yes stop_codon:yes gene_type:complete